MPSQRAKYAATAPNYATAKLGTGTLNVVEAATGHEYIVHQVWLTPQGVAGDNVYTLRMNNDSSQDVWRGNVPGIANTVVIVFDPPLICDRMDAIHTSGTSSTFGSCIAQKVRKGT